MKKIFKIGDGFMKALLRFYCKTTKHIN